MNDKRIVWIMLQMIFGAGSTRLWELSANYDSADEFYKALKDHEISDATEKEYALVDKVTEQDAQKVLDRCDKNGINVYCYESEGYPQRLKAIADPPPLLFCYGNLDFLDHMCVIAIVGTRTPSDYSVSICKYLCKDLISKNIVLASGFANGIDQIANDISLVNDMPTVAVCGTPLEFDYPAGSLEIKKQIARKGVVISEHIPGSKQYNHNFKRRNRILVGISRGVVFIEAGMESHGLNNYEHAISQGKPVFVVPPSDLTDKRYFGQRHLLRNECIPIFNAEDVIYRLALDSFDSFAFTRDLGDYNLPADDSDFYSRENTVQTAKSQDKSESKDQADNAAAADKIPEIDYSQLDENETKICKVLEEGRCLADNLSLKTGIDITTVLSTLTMLELEGIVESLPGNQFRLANIQ